MHTRGVFSSRIFRNQASSDPHGNDKTRATRTLWEQDCRATRLVLPSLPFSQLFLPFQRSHYPITSGNLEKIAFEPAIKSTSCFRGLLHQARRSFTHIAKRARSRRSFIGRAIKTNASEIMTGVSHGAERAFNKSTSSARRRIS